jgi:hypothetical protein
MSANNDFVPRKATETKIASAKTAPRSIRNAGLIPLLILVSRIRKKSGPVANINKTEKGSAERTSFIYSVVFEKIIDPPNVLL